MDDQREADSLNAIAADAEAVPQWHPYAAYCRARAMGLRADALAHLEAFLEGALQWPYPDRRAFVSWLCERKQRVSITDKDLPFPLFTLLVRPTLEEWAWVESRDPRPHRWLGMFLRFGRTSREDDERAEAELRIAVDLDPEEQPARVQRAHDILAHLEDSAHELPEFYLGDPAADVLKAEEVARLLAGVRDDDVRRTLEAEAKQYRQLARNWLDFTADGGADFAQWARERGRLFEDCTSLAADARWLPVRESEDLPHQGVDRGSR